MMTADKHSFPIAILKPTNYTKAFPQAAHYSYPRSGRMVEEGGRKGRETGDGGPACFHSIFTLPNV